MTLAAIADRLRREAISDYRRAGLHEKAEGIEVAMDALEADPEFRLPARVVALAKEFRLGWRGPSLTRIQVADALLTLLEETSAAPLSSRRRSSRARPRPSGPSFLARWERVIRSREEGLIRDVSMYCPTCRQDEDHWWNGHLWKCRLCGGEHS